MPYLSLYRKYRPRSFTQIVGQRHVTQTLVNALRAGRVAHAYLFCGPRGTGKTSTARVLAMALNCEQGPTPEPDGVCEACRRIIAGSALDVIEIDAASNRGIDEIRQLRERVGLAAADARTKVYIIDEVHMLTGEAFNAFLKTLEEPPGHVVFVLATTEPHRVLPTILSRCQRFDFHRIGQRDIEATVREVAHQEQVVIEEDAVSMLAYAADGSVRDALTLLDQAIAYAEGPVTAEVVSEILGGVDFDLVAAFTEAMISRDITAALNLIDRVVAEGKDLRQLVGNLILHHRNLLVLAATGGRGESAPGGLTLPEELVKRSAEQVRLLSGDEIVQTLELLAEVDRELRFSSQPRLLVELAAVRICRRPTPAAAAPRPAAQAARPPATTQVLPGTAPSAADQVAEAEAVSSLTIGEIKRRWEDLLADLRKRRKASLAGVLVEAVPVELAQDTLTLSFAKRHEFHYTRLSQDEKRQADTSDALMRVFGRRLTTACRLESNENPAGAAGGERPGRVQEALSAFPGSEIEE